MAINGAQWAGGGRHLLHRVELWLAPARAVLLGQDGRQRLYTHA
eukprot:SAG25_NODE_3108_length_1214_cov_1.748879_1_plen_43_part_10